MMTEVPFRILKGKIPVFSSIFPSPEIFSRYIDMPDIELFKKIYRRRQHVAEENLELYWTAINARFQGLSMQKAGDLISRSRNRVQQVEQRFLRGLVWYEKYVERL
jgi:hypothetical protein